MGAIADAIKSFDKSDEEQAKIREQLELFFELGDNRAQVAEAEIKKRLEESREGRGLYVPIDTVKEWDHEIHVLEKDGLNNGITDTVSKSIKGFIKGGSDNIVDGVVNLVSEGLNAFLGSGAGSEDQYSKYFIVNEGELSLVRFDVWGWKRKAVGSGIEEKYESVSAFVGFKSIIDFEKLRFPTFINLYQEQLRNSGLPDNDMKAAIEQAKQIFETMTGKEHSSNEVDFDSLLTETSQRRGSAGNFHLGFDSGFSNLKFE